MFLYALSEEQKQLFCKAALSLIHADGVVDAREQELREALMREMWLRTFPTEVSTVEELAPELGALSGAREARLILLELTGVALVDGDLSPSEVHWLQHVASALGISGDELARFCDFAASAANLAVEARTLVFEPESAPSS